MQTFMIEQQHFFESTELLHTHEIEKQEVYLCAFSSEQYSPLSSLAISFF